MPSTYSTSLRIELVADNEQSGIWGQTTNRNFTQVFEEALTATAEVDVAAGDVTLTAVNGATDQARRPFIRIIGTPVVARQVNVPDVTKLYMVQNTTGQSVTIKPTGQTGVTLLTGQFGYVRCRQGLSAQLVEFLTTVGGNLTVPGTLTVGGATTINNTLAVTGTATFTGIINLTEPNDALNIRSGSAVLPTAITLGRTTLETYFAVSGGANNFTLGDIAGDTSIRLNSGSFFLSTAGGAPRLKMLQSGEFGIGANPVGSVPLLVHTGTNRNVAFLDQGSVATVSGMTDAGSSASLRVVGNTLQFSGSGSGVQATMDTSGRLAIGTSAATYHLQVATTGSDLLGLFRDLDVTSSGAAGASLDIGARNGATFTPGARIFGVLENPASTGFLAFYTRTASALSEKARFDSLGNFGIGAVPGAYRLDVVGGGARVFHNDGLRLVNSASTMGATINPVAASGLWLSTDSGDVLMLPSGVERFRVLTGGRIYGTALHNNAGSMTGTANQYIGSGTFAPTQTGVTNVASVGSSNVQWMRVGNVVTVSGRVSVTPTGAGTTQVRSTLPIASAIANPYDIAGNGCVSPTSPTVLVNAADPSTDNAYFTFTAASGASVDIYFSYTYVVL